MNRDEVTFKMVETSGVAFSWSPETGWVGERWSEGGEPEDLGAEAALMGEQVFGGWVMDLVKELAEKPIQPEVWRGEDLDELVE